MRPYLETLPYVGLSPTTPQKLEGCLIDPPVSDPKEAKAPRMATAAAEPPEEPPATRSVSYGFFVTPYAEFSVELPIANSSILVLPKKMLLSLLSLTMT